MIYITYITYNSYPLIPFKIIKKQIYKYSIKDYNRSQNKTQSIINLKNK